MPDHGLSQRLAPHLELNLFRIVQEATTNIQKHARAKTIRVNLTLRNNVVLLKIRDDGRGFASKKSSRARMGGALCGSAYPCRSTGTAIIVRVPATELK